MRTNPEISIQQLLDSGEAVWFPVFKIDYLPKYRTAYHPALSFSYLNRPYDLVHHVADLVSDILVAEAEFTHVCPWETFLDTHGPDNFAVMFEMVEHKMSKADLQEFLDRVREAFRDRYYQSIGATRIENMQHFAHDSEKRRQIAETIGLQILRNGPSYALFFIPKADGPEDAWDEFVDGCMTSLGLEPRGRFDHFVPLSISFGAANSETVKNELTEAEQSDTAKLFDVMQYRALDALGLSERRGGDCVTIWDPEDPEMMALTGATPQGPKEKKKPWWKPW